MEGVADSRFRKAIAYIGGFDHACTEFLRVPTGGHVVSLAKRYDPNETAPIPQAAQIMGSDPELMGAMCLELAKRGAPRIDLNCGCPSNTVTGRGAGSSLLKDPELLYQVAKSMVDSVDIPVTAKLRSGFLDTSLFKENLMAAQESGIAFLTLHPRTKAEGYGPPANWDLIAEAKNLLKIPVVGNGDILNAKHALNMLNHTKCDGLMIGRGSVINPYIFWEIKACFEGSHYTRNIGDLLTFLTLFKSHFEADMRPKVRVNKLKQLVSFLFKANETLLEMRNNMLADTSSEDEYFCKVIKILKNHY
ncbi:MAG: tRNA-dihydrouridine synthase family protein [Parachlamydiales bacterium]|nr:tRNA-dihydrouridine synthase family protein [Parachlamydiales bacterium]